MSTYTEVEARFALVTKLLEIHGSSEFATLPVYGENGPGPNMDTLKTLIHYEIVFDDTEQATLGADPATRTWGRIELVFGTREGTGTLPLLRMRAMFQQGFKGLRLGGVNTLIPKPGKPNTGNGWRFERLLVPFYFDTLPLL